jgi:hypothetical protein
MVMTNYVFTENYLWYGQIFAPFRFTSAMIDDLLALALQNPNTV